MISDLRREFQVMKNAVFAAAYYFYYFFFNSKERVGCAAKNGFE